MLGLLLYTHKFLRLYYSLIFILLSLSYSYRVISFVPFSHSPFFPSLISCLSHPWRVLRKYYFSNYIFLSLKLFIWYYFIFFISLMVRSNFCCFRCVVNFSSNHFYYVCFNSKIPVISCFTSIDCSFSFALRSLWFLVCQMIIIETWTFSHYVMRLDLKAFSLAGFPCCHFFRGKGQCAASLLTDRSRILGSPQGMDVLMGILVPYIISTDTVIGIALLFNS